MWYMWERKKHVNKQMWQINVEKCQKIARKAETSFYVWNLKKKERYNLTYLQKNSIRVTDIEYKLTLPGDTWEEG